jgi:GTP pyrophosphokinase
MEPLLSDLLLSCHSTPRPVDESKIKLAWEFASAAHSGQKRLSGLPYITHPVQVAKTLALWNLDTTSVIAGLLHDTIEDGNASREQLVNLFGEDVGIIVDGVTKITGIRLKGSTDTIFVENLRKMLLVMASDPRVILVKLADRLHNMQTLNFLPQDRQVINARETLEIYAPLAERLGMGEIKGRLEDLAFPYVYPEKYKNLSTQIKPLLGSGQLYIDNFKKRVLALTRPQIPGVNVNSRQKHLYSLFKKLQRPEISGDISKIYDLFAARILVDTIPECYLALGLVHGQFRPVPFLGLSDFIATPKPNGYRSLHTKVFGPEGRIVELQIRTKEMHQQAEMGIAAHWAYSEAKQTGASDFRLEHGLASDGSKISWVRELLEWYKEIQDDNEYLRVLKIDAFQHRLLVFSPKGDVYDLPAESTPIDFAYAVHTDLGSQSSAAKVNGKMVQLDHKLKNGDVVEITVNRKHKKANHNWLDFVVTNTAKREIAKSLKENPA